MTRVITFLQPGWADWEAGPVLALLREQFGGRTRVATPDGGTVTSVGGLTVKGDLAFHDPEPGDADAWLLIGSDAWPEYRDKAFFTGLRRALDAGRVVGAICAGTVAAARAGLFEGRTHTSNGLDWLLEQAPGYAGHEGYLDQAAAVTDGHLVSASGLAPITFAASVARLIDPEKAGELTVYEHLYAREFGVSALARAASA